jgi:hypothetical protein
VEMTERSVDLFPSKPLRMVAAGKVQTRAATGGCR